MYFFSNRERKIMHITMLINALVLTGILHILLPHRQSILFIVYCFIGIYIFQIYVMVAPRIFESFFFGSLHPKDEQKILERKIECLQEEIKRINGEDYNEDVFHDF